MSKPDYTDFDALLLDQIRAGKTRMAQLEMHKPLLELAKPFCANTRTRSGYTTPEWRVIDRRLQALRKAGTIKHCTTIGWRIVE